MRSLGGSCGRFVSLTPTICTATETLCRSWPPLDQQQQTNMQHLHSYATMILRKLSREHMSLCKYQDVRLQAVELRHDIPMIPILADLDKRHSVGNREKETIWEDLHSPYRSLSPSSIPTQIITPFLSTLIPSVPNTFSVLLKYRSTTRNCGVIQAPPTKGRIL